MRFDDLHGERKYGKWSAHGQSKLANLLFTYELQRRLAAKHVSTISVASHPGYAATNLQFEGPRMQGSKLLELQNKIMNQFLSQTAEMGALPTLYAATSPDVRGGDYIGPSSFAELWGAPRKVSSNKRSHDVNDARQLWELSEKLTGVRYEALDA
jgi:NAD(P)-dependent dehydrogenase (short-subunit alcohol dehydrogenase family)